MKEFICICCPMGCHLSVDDTDKDNIIVTGNTCARGAKYGKDEVTNPVRMVTSSVKVVGGTDKVLSVKTSEAIPKPLIFDSLQLLKGVEVKAPIKIGDVIIKNILGTGADFIATREIEELNG